MTFQSPIKTYVGFKELKDEEVKEIVPSSEAGATEKVSGRVRGW